MVRLRLIVLLFALLAAVACRPHTVDLVYRFEEGQSLTYDLTAEARASWDIGGSGEGSYRISYLVTESVVSAGAEEATIEVVMSPVSVEEEGLPSPGPEDRTFTMRVGQNGRTLEVLRVDGVAAESLDPNDLVFIGLYRPPLPLERVALDDRWATTQDLSVGEVSQEGSSTGRLEALQVAAGSKVAELVYEMAGPIEWSTQLPQGAAELAGSSLTEARTTLDIDNGRLRGAESSTEGEFEVTILPRGGDAPLAGTLRLDLELALESV